MAEYDHKCVPFMASVKTGFFNKEGADTIASQLQAVINSNAVGGWEFYAVYQVQTLTKPGCLGSIFGKSQEVLPYDIVCFRKPK